MPAVEAAPGERARLPALRRGFRLRCPNCGRGALFGRYLKPVERCAECGEGYAHIRADDAPPYFTIFAVGHIWAPLALWVERGWQPSLWVHAALWGPSLIGLMLVLLPCFKGATIGVMWASRMGEGEA
ncbi:MAG TPA: DUF983 domain-containing protein [Alphaproteobacteria bacterium]|nr:DUF983 domain-containing protein [Alphaproteobacteria bacterium]